MANDPVLQRSMFQKQTSVAPSVGLGIDSVTTPDQNAKALKSMFQPTVSLGMPTQMLQQEQQPIQSFQEGGFATPLIAQYNFRNRQYQNPPSYAERVAAANEPTAVDPFTSYDVDQEEARSLTPEARRSLDRPQGTLVPTGGFYTPGGPGLPQSDARRRVLEQLAQTPAGPPREAAEPEIRREYREEVRKAAIPPAAIPPAASSVARMLENDRAQEPRMPTSPAERKLEDTSVKTNLDDIKADRRATDAARTSAERRENMLLALMQAGFAMAAGRSPNAISNIGAGGQAGIAAFASMERARREDESLRRREQLQLDIAKMQYDRDPEAVRTYALLGGWTPDQGRDKLVEAAKRGFDFMQTKEAPARAEALLKAASADPLRGTPGALISPEEARRLSQFLYGNITSTLTQRGERSGQPSGPQTFKLDELPRSK
jgi:hypothetical protein